MSAEVRRPLDPARRLTWQEIDAAHRRTLAALPATPSEWAWYGTDPNPSEAMHEIMRGRRLSETSFR